MILRGAKVSAHVVHVAADVSGAKGAEPTAAPSGPLAAEVRPVIDAVMVRAWLAKQDDAVRRQLAVELAPEIAAEYAAGRTRGWQEGQDEAAATARADREGHAAALRQVAAELRAVAERQAAALAASCAEIVMEVLKKIAGPTLAQPGSIEGAVVQVLRRVKEASEVVVRVRPAELETLTLARPALAEALGDAELTLLADQRVQLGGCIVESKFGNLDGRLEVQLGELCETLRLAKIEGTKQ
jgi:flagellar biosynthesis/type III secretory pathway protein FliH